MAISTMSTAAIIASTESATCATPAMLTAERLADGKPRETPQVPCSPASDVPDSPMSAKRPPPMPLKLCPSEDSGPWTCSCSSDDELDSTDVATTAAIPPADDSASASVSSKQSASPTLLSPVGARRRGVRWPARRGATAGLPEPCLPPRTVALPRRGSVRTTVPAATRRHTHADGVRWPARRGATAGLDHTIIALQCSATAAPSMRER